MNVAIVGCGLIGTKRAAALRKVGEDRLVAVCDVDKNRMKSLATGFGCEEEPSWNRLVTRNDVDAVIVSTTNALLEQISVAALEAGKNVLCEKPLGRSVAEAQRMVDAAGRRKLTLKTGFNHRFHPSLAKAKEFLDKGTIGKCLTIRARYGHGSRPGMENEWRSSKEQSGGGELLDQGVHVIDLIRWMGGEIREVFGKSETLYWKIPVEDNAFAFLKTDRDIRASFHVSWTNWKNIFSFEVFGTEGYLSVQGLGGSYGPETLEVGLRKKEGGKPDIEIIEFPDEDSSWNLEWLEFRDAVIKKRQPSGSGEDGLRANRVIEALYESSKAGSVVRL